ncbi:MAG: polysaccharide biosynthesis protein [Bacillota bacterium]|nr:polysaccharide biosynthesis protein [Bacillota bacterium]
MYEDKVLLITGGTGSFGNALVQHVLDHSFREIRIFSRDEKKQDDMRKKYHHDKLKFYIGDTRNIDSVNNAMKGVDFIFHAAALKQVPTCEFFPMEAVQTNILGTNNVLLSAINNKVSKVVCLSTDKAAYPINAMGMTKALMEKTAIAVGRNLAEDETVITLTRYGNVMASRGSVIPLFNEQIDRGADLTITNPDMTRFMMTLQDAVDLVLYAFENGRQGDLFIQKAPAATIDVLARAVLKLRQSSSKIRIIGTRHGEKLYETLVTKEEMVKAIDLGAYYRIPADTRDLNYEKYFSEGDAHIPNSDEYNSHNTQRLTVDEMVALLKRADLFAD